MTSSKISLSILAQTKMALHSARHSFSNPIHGILLGQRSPSLLEVTDVLPVCHEVPTKPIVDMALRFADIYLQQKEGLEIVGWYTANPNVTSSDKEEMPNISACRVVSSMAEQINSNEGLVLILLSAIGVISSLGEKEQEGTSSTPVCSVFEKDGKTRTFTQKVDASRVITNESTRDELSEVIVRALKGMSKFSSEYDEATTAGGLIIYDFVDHITDFENKNDLDEKDWIENKAIVEFVNGYLKTR